jgi:hypothetical protein
MGRLSPGIACFVALALGVASPATAAQRYAAPEGNGPEPCAKAEPCSLENAATKASSGDEVILGSGAYKLTKELFVNATELSIHGDLSGPMPKISATLPYVAIQVEGAGSVVSYLEITDTVDEAQALFCVSTIRVERVRLSAVGENATGLGQGPGCTVRDSLVLAAGTGATAISEAGLNGMANVIRNVTAIATGSESVGIRALNEDMFTPGVHVLDLKNSIVQGAKLDLLARVGFEYPGEIVVSHSNFDRASEEGTSKVVDQGGNQTATPLFVDSANGDYHEAPGSPTIEAGVADQLGTLDLDGNPRMLGPAVDIGAFETQVPPVPSAPTGQLQSLAITPKTFRAVNAGGAIVSRKSRKRPPIGATVAYSMSAAGTASFTVQRTLSGRRVGKACKPVTHTNRHHKKCTRSKPVKGSFAMESGGGAHSFKFSGRVDGKALRPGRYRLLCSAGGVTMSAPFRVVK